MCLKPRVTPSSAVALEASKRRAQGDLLGWPSCPSPLALPRRHQKNKGVAATGANGCLEFEVEGARAACRAFAAYYPRAQGNTSTLTPKSVVMTH